MGFGDLLRSFRARSALTQEDLAERSGVSVHAISTLESGRRQPRLSSVARLADALGLTGDERERFIAAASPAAATLSTVARAGDARTTTTGTGTATGTGTGTGTDTTTGTATGTTSASAATGTTSVGAASAGGSTSTGSGVDGDHADQAGPAASRDVPRQLPGAIRHFAGRSHEISELRSLLAGLGPWAGGSGSGDGSGGDADASGASPGSSGPIVISAIRGAAGIGKTALAVRFAHEIAERFPDGQLFLNLRGFDPSGSPMDAETAMRGFLAALGVPAAEVPIEPHAQVALYRSRLAGTRTLIVLDNARDAEQVRPLLPGEGSCLVLVTSRDRLAGLVALDGAVPLPIDVLDDGEALELLARRLGADRVHADPEAARQLIGLCGGVPLALNIAAAKIVAQRGVPLQQWADELRETRRRLDALTTGESATDMRAVLSWSYRTLSTEAARAFRLLALDPGAEIGVPAAANMVGLSVEETRRALDEVAAANLIGEVSFQRFAFHDLVRLYARELVDEEPEDIRSEAVARLGTWYLHSAHAAAQAMATKNAPVALADPGDVVPLAFDSHEAALRWFDLERENLVATILAAGSDSSTDGGARHVTAWQLAITMRGYFLVRHRLDDWLRTHEVGLASARAVGDVEAEVRILNNTGSAHRQAQRLHAAEAVHREALALSMGAGYERGTIVSRINLGTVLCDMGRYEDAIEVESEVLALCQKNDDLLNQGIVLLNMAVARFHQGLYPEAVATYEQALVVNRRTGHRYSEAITLGNLAEVLAKSGHLDAALVRYQEALAIYRELGDERLEAQTHMYLGEILDTLGREDEALVRWRESLALYDKIGLPEAGVARDRLERGAQPPDRSPDRTPS